MNDLPQLDSIDVASPCTADWDAMDGSDTVRYCGECRKNVYNLSGMTRPEAEQVVRQHEGRLCVRFYRRHDGSLLTSDCPVGLRALRRRIARRLAAVAAMFGTLLLGRASSTRTAHADEPAKAPPVAPHPALMGDICIPAKKDPAKDPPPVMGRICITLPAGWEQAAAVTVSARQTWVKTSVTVADGGQIELRLDPHFKNTWSSSPTVQNVSAEGDASKVAPAGYCLPGHADGCLVARIGDVRHYVGKGTKLTPRKGGVVYLSINDDEENQHGDGFKDNDGEMHVLVRLVDSPATEPAAR